MGKEREDFSSEIEMELRQLITLAELLRELEDPPETRKNFFLGLSEMIEGHVDRIAKMVDATYNEVYENGAEYVRTKIFHELEQLIKLLPEGLDDLKDYIQSLTPEPGQTPAPSGGAA
jgi:hypothetical protein